VAVVKLTVDAHTTVMTVLKVLGATYTTKTAIYTVIRSFIA